MTHIIIENPENLETELIYVSHNTSKKIIDDLIKKQETDEKNIEIIYEATPLI